MGSIKAPPLPLLPHWGNLCVYVYVRGLSFGYRENLFFFFELFKFDKSRYFPESYSNSEKKIVLLMGSVQICSCGFGCERE